MLLFSYWNALFIEIMKYSSRKFYIEEISLGWKKVAAIFLL